MAMESPGHTLQPTALVHEAWLQLAGDDGQARFQNRGHFFGAAAEAMRRILIERARRRLAAKRGAGAGHLDLDEMEIASPLVDDDALLALKEAFENSCDELCADDGFQFQLSGYLRKGHV